MTLASKQRLIYCFVAAVFIIVAAAVAMAYLRSHAEREIPVKSLDTWQHADAPLGYPLKDGVIPPFDPDMIQLNAFERLLIPQAKRMSQPMGTEHGALIYNAQAYWEDNRKRGGRHSGDDLNGIGGMNTDLGDPVYAIANGLVVYRGEPSKGWGNILILAHRLPDNTIVQSFYSHLDRSTAALGEMVAIGQPIGTVGTANLNYPAHLHFEMRDTSGVWITRGYLNRPLGHLDPTEEINRYQSGEPHRLFSSPLASIQRERLEAMKEKISIENFLQKKTKDSGR